MNLKEWNELKRKEDMLRKIAEIFRVEEKDVPRVVSRFINEVKEMESSNT
jgi:transposase-like protein